MDDRLAQDLIDMGKDVIKEFACTKDEIKDVRNEMQSMRDSVGKLTTLLQGNGTKGFLKRLEDLEGRAILKNPVTYIALVSLAIALTKLIMG